VELPTRLPGPDRYEWNARLKPALFVVLPTFILAAVWLPAVWTALGGLSSLFVTCGATYLLAQIARQRGRALQKHLAGQLGPDLTMKALRHTDPTIDGETKARYHQILRAHGRRIPTAAEEQVDPVDADGCYRACMTWLLEATRDKKRFPLLAEENIAYGYRRNLLALKPIAVPVVLLSLAANSAALWLHGSALDARLWTGVAVEIGMIAVAAIWLFVVRLPFVTDASAAYAVRLLACCDNLPAATRAAGSERAAPVRTRKPTGKSGAGS